jgi:hypothetical protein
MNLAKAVLLVLISWLPVVSFTQSLQPGFNKNEYIELIKAYSRWGACLFS